MTHHFLYAAIPAACVFSAFGVYSVSREPALSRSMSHEATKLISKIEESQSPPPQRWEEGLRETLCFSDNLSIYLCSRNITLRAHRLSLRYDDPEIESWRLEAELKHDRMKKLLLLSACERLFGGVFGARFPFYTRDALWTFVEELAIIGELERWTSTGQC